MLDFDLAKGSKLRHVIEPRVGWAYVSARQQDRNPLFTPRGVVEQSRFRTLSLESITRDPADRIEAANRVVVGVGQRFWRRRHSRAPLRFTGELLTAVDWDFAEGGLGNVLLDGRLMPTGPISARAVLAFDPEAAAVDEGGAPHGTRNKQPLHPPGATQPGRLRWLSCLSSWWGL